MKRRLEQTYEEANLSALRTLTERYTKISQFIRKSIATAEDVEEMNKFLQELVGERVQLKLKASSCFSKVLFLEKLDIDVSEPTTMLTKDLFEWPEKLDRELQNQEEKHAVEQQRLEEALREKRYKFEQRVDVYLDDLKYFEECTEYNKYKDYIGKVDEFEKVVQEAKALMDEIIDQEKKLFGFISNFDKFGGL